MYGKAPYMRFLLPVYMAARAFGMEKPKRIKK